MQLDDTLKKILGKFHDNPKAAVWDCHGTWVAYHKDLEIIAGRAGITFEPPVVLEADGKNKCAALCVSGILQDKKEWSVGEAAPGNNKNGYPFAMAEKRAKDRVILKLLGIHGQVYSEEEADNFKPTKSGLKEQAHEICQELRGCTDMDMLTAYWGTITDALRNMKTGYPDGYDACMAQKDKMKDELVDVAERHALEDA